MIFYRNGKGRACPIIFFYLSYLFWIVQTNNPREIDTHYFYIIEASDSSLVDVFCFIFGFGNLGSIGIVEDHYAISAPKINYSSSASILELVAEHQNDPNSQHYRVSKAVNSIEEQGLSTVTTRRFTSWLRKVFFNRNLNNIRTDLNIYDPGFQQQWHLFNSAESGNDINVIPVWRQGITGKGVTVALVDDGIDHSSSEMINFRAEGSYNFYSRQQDPKPENSDSTHGTRCAGEVAAARDSLCGVGVAYDANISGIRALPVPLIESDQAISIAYESEVNDIYSCSWGPEDNGQVLEGPPKIVSKAMELAIQKGRNNLGSLYVFASGNGGAFDDNCNFDGYANSIYTIAVGAIDHLNAHPIYSEGCSALLVVTYSGGGGNSSRGIFTTDVGGKCTDQHSGTSAAAPIVSGILALLLEKNNLLTWRDVQHLLIQTAIPISENHNSWSKTYSGRSFSNLFGYGKVDAARLIEAASNYTNVASQTVLSYGPFKVEKVLEDSNLSNIYYVTVTQDHVLNFRFDSIEHVTVTLNIDHLQRRDVEISLTSPHNIVSNLVESRINDLSKDGFKNWTVMSVKHWDESPIGTWRLEIRDIYPNNNFDGFIKDWSIVFYGKENRNLVLHTSTKSLKLRDMFEVPLNLLNRVRSIFAYK